MKYIGYHRTSTMEQHLERGVTEIRRYCRERGIGLYKDKVYTDQHTGRDFSRPGYIIVKQELLEPGDALIVSELDRLGRSKPDTLKELQYFKENGIRVMILEIPTTLLDYGGMENALAAMMMETVNNMLIEMYATFAQAEMDKREKRQREGIEAMKERGEWNRYGRPRVMEFDEFMKEYSRVLRGEIRPFRLMRELGIKESTFYKYKGQFEREKKQKQKEEEEEMEKKKEEFSKEQIERAIGDLKATMAMEGIELTKENIDSSRKILSGEADADELLAEIIQKHQK